MDASDRLRGQAAKLAADANDLHDASTCAESWPAVPDVLADLEQLLQVLGSSCNEVAAGAAPTVSRFRLRLNPHAPAVSVDTGLSREQEVQLISVLHDLASDLTACARSCRNARAIVAPLTLRRLEATSEETTRPMMAGNPG